MAITILGMMSILTRKDKDKTLLELYHQGLSYPEIADRMSISRDAAQARIRRLQKQIKATEPETVLGDINVLRDRIRELRGQGLSMKAIARQIGGITKPQVYRHLQAIGLE